MGADCITCCNSCRVWLAGSSSQAQKYLAMQSTQKHFALIEQSSLVTEHEFQMLLNVDAGAEEGSPWEASICSALWGGLPGNLGGRSQFDCLRWRSRDYHVILLDNLHRHDLGASCANCCLLCTCSFASGIYVTDSCTAAACVECASPAELLKI